MWALAVTRRFAPDAVIAQRHVDAEALRTLAAALPGLLADRDALSAERADVAKLWDALAHSNRRETASRLARERAESALRTVRDGFDHDEDAHKYGTACRVCVAASVIGAGEWLSTWDARAVGAARAGHDGAA